MSIPLVETNMRVTVAGLGEHGGGVGTVRWLLSKGAVVTVTDTKTKEELTSSIRALKDEGLYDRIRLVLGEHREEDFTDTDLVIRNPAMPRHSPYLEVARNNAVPIEMDSSLFFAHCPASDIIGITGSKGKTTTVYAISSLLHRNNADVVSVGTDGVSPLGELDSIHENTTVVFELSSWRLEALDRHNVSPSVAVVTSLYKEHLNTYASFEEYIDTKKSIVRHQRQHDIAILNADDAILASWDNMPGSVLRYGVRDHGKDGIYIDSDTVYVRRENHVDPLIPTNALPWKHEHGMRNLLPAILISHLRGMTPKDIQHALSCLTPLAHRLERVRELDGVTYVNDTTATMPDAVIAALSSYKKHPLILILGGNDKDLEFEGLGHAISQANVRHVIWLPGTATQKMKRYISAPSTDVRTMEEAVTMARMHAKTGDTVLLSPGATSFGLFAHEFHRGDVFREAVEALA